MYGCIMKRLGLVVALISGFLANTAFADTLVLVQGYRGDAGSWRGTGITRVLQQNGWRDAGHLSARAGQILRWSTSAGGTNRFYTIDLPTEAPITVQTGFLSGYLGQIAKLHKGEPLHLAGHSAGGVVARATMVSFPALKIKTLITIASPHRGTGSAETGLQVSNSPLGWFAPMVGAGTVNRSRGLYRQLVRERPGTYLGWLNRQQHPKARYVSIVRAGSDDVVPSWSQDLNGVVQLAGKAETYPVSGRHELSVYDGVTIKNLLAVSATCTPMCAGKLR